MAAGNPKMVPSRHATRLSRKIIHSTCWRCAPTAMRTPIAAVRRTILYASVA